MAEIPHSAVVSVIDLPLYDLIHVGPSGPSGPSGLERLGRRLAKIARRELLGERHLEIGPRLAGVEVGDGGRTLRIRSTSVDGRLLPRARVTGFSLTRADGGPFPSIYAASVDPERPDTVVLRLRWHLPDDGARLWCGSGLDPVCNLVEAEDMAALAFGPVPVAPIEE